MQASLKLSSSQLSDIRDLAVRVTLINDGDLPLARELRSLRIAPLVLEVVDQQGVKVVPVPPQVPDMDDTVQELQVLVAGEALHLDYAGCELFDRAVPAGRYRLRFCFDVMAVTSQWVEFQVK